MKNSPGVLEGIVLKRLADDPKAQGAWTLLVEAALQGEAEVARLLDAQAPPESRSVRAGKPPEPRGAYLKSIAVEGFRGIGEKAELVLPAGVGLTLVIGRNGSGKSSFAEALEVLLTDETYRWKDRSARWREGWRNLHHTPAEISAEFHIEGESGPGRVWRQWPADAELTDGQTAAQIQGKPKGLRPSFGWEEALATYRPFLSYSELGAMIAQEPSKLYDALSAILGLEELTAAQDALAAQRKPREQATKDAGEDLAGVTDMVSAIGDPRAQAILAAVKRKPWDLAALEEVVAEGAGAAHDDVVRTLQRLASLPSPDRLPERAAALREAARRQREAAGTLASRSKDLAHILDCTLRFHDAHGDTACPVCGRTGALDEAWRIRQPEHIQRLRAEAEDATRAQAQVDDALRAARALPWPPDDIVALAASVGLSAQAASDAAVALRRAVEQPDLEAVATGLESYGPVLAAALEAVREAARGELQRREDRWKPVLPRVAAWLAQALAAQNGAEPVKELKAAEDWLKKTAGAIRTERFEPLKERARAIWEQLKLQSSVTLHDIKLTGSKTKRAAALDVKVDGAEGSALGVISQGEQNALALCLFIPRATLDESPFRFVVIDDPVQSMDPARVDGLARVLAETARTRQVVVFTHDDRLADATRRLRIEATVIEVTRREGSRLDVRTINDPVGRYIEDAMALAYTDDLPEPAARRVIPGLCRLAIEAACIEAFRRRRLAAGEPHAAVERMVREAPSARAKAALALFDDREKGKDVLARLNKQSPSFADAFRAVNEGAHEGLSRPDVGVVRSAEKLAKWMRAL